MKKGKENNCGRLFRKWPNTFMWVPALAGTGGLQPASTNYGANFHASAGASQEHEGLLCKNESIAGTNPLDHATGALWTREK